MVVDQLCRSRSAFLVLAMTAMWLSVPSASAAPSPILRWSFDESSSGTSPAGDTGATAPAASGTFSGAATRTGNTPGNFSAGALNVTGNAAAGNHVASSGDVNKTDALSAMTVTGWINFQGAPTQLDEIVRDAPIVPTDAGQGGWSVGILDGDEPGFSASNFSLTFSKANATGSVINEGGIYSTALDADNKWLFFAATFDTSTGLMQLYTGGPTTPVTFNRSGLSAAGPIADNLRELYVGGYPASSDRTPNAFLDDIRVYGSVLSTTDLNAVRLSNVPEPTAAAALLAAAAIATARRRRRRPDRTSN